MLSHLLLHAMVYLVCVWSSCRFILMLYDGDGIWTRVFTYAANNFILHCPVWKHVVTQIRLARIYVDAYMILEMTTHCTHNIISHQLTGSVPPLQDINIVIQNNIFEQFIVLLLVAEYKIICSIQNITSTGSLRSHNVFPH